MQFWVIALVYCIRCRRKWQPTHQYSCLENPMDRRTWQATVCGVARVRCDLATTLLPLQFALEKEMQPTAGFLPGEFHGQRSLADCSPWGHRESDMTEWLTHTQTHTLHSNSYLFVLAVLGLCCWSGFSLVAVSGGYCPLRCMGFSLQWLLLLQSTGSRTCGLQ